MNNLKNTFLLILLFLFVFSANLSAQEDASEVEKTEETTKSKKKMVFILKKERK